MRSALLALPVVLALVGCSQASEDVASSTDNLSDGETKPASKECVIDTIVVQPGLLKDFKNAVDPSFIKQFPAGAYPHLQIPGVFDAALSSSDEFGEWFYTIIGTDLEHEKLADFSEGPKLDVVLTGSPSDDPTLVTGKRMWDASKAVFDAMTRATETTTEHHAQPHTFDTSWKIVRRASANGRVVCEAHTNPDTDETRPTFTCTFADVKSTNVQIFSTDEGTNRCLAE